MSRLGTIVLTWDSNGNINHHFDKFISVNEYQEWDGLASSVPMLVLSQLGVLSPVQSILLGSRIIALLQNGKIETGPVNSEIKGATIDLFSDGPHDVYHTFNPKASLFANNNNVETGVRHLIANYTQYIFRILPNEHLIRLRYLLGVSLNFYYDLGELPAKEILSGKVIPNKTSGIIQMHMTQVSRGFYLKVWNETGGFDQSHLDETIFQKSVTNLYNSNQKLGSKLGIV